MWIMIAAVVVLLNVGILLVFRGLPLKEQPLDSYKKRGKGD